jgi:copper chaperone CopZ
MERNDAQQRWNFYSLLKPTKGSARFKVIRNMKTKTAIISIDNLKAEDLQVLKQALQSVPGVDTVDFNLERSVAVVDFDPTQSHIDDFLRAVLKAGFKVL